MYHTGTNFPSGHPRNFHESRPMAFAPTSTNLHIATLGNVSQKRYAINKKWTVSTCLKNLNDQQPICGVEACAIFWRSFNEPSWTVDGGLHIFVDEAP
jgi:hypothetical protein